MARPALHTPEERTQLVERLKGLLSMGCTVADAARRTELSKATAERYLSASGVRVSELVRTKPPVAKCNEYAMHAKRLRWNQYFFEGRGY